VVNGEYRKEKLAYTKVSIGHTHHQPSLIRVFVPMAAIVMYGSVFRGVCQFSRLPSQW
jgi:hypothetical protein